MSPRLFKPQQIVGTAHTEALIIHTLSCGVIVESESREAKLTERWFDQIDGEWECRHNVIDVATHGSVEEVCPDCHPSFRVDLYFEPVAQPLPAPSISYISERQARNYILDAPEIMVPIGAPLGMGRFLEQSMIDVMYRAMRTVPIDTGALRASANPEPNIVRGNIDEATLYRPDGSIERLGDAISSMSFALGVSAADAVAGFGTALEAMDNAGVQWVDEHGVPEYPNCCCTTYTECAYCRAEEDEDDE